MSVRALDILASLAAFALFFPVVLVACALVWAQDFKSPFYLSFRVGFQGRKFLLFKLRSMVVGADKSKVDTTVAGDQRVTRIGWHIRKYKIDELPQFLNVLKGDMSLVGPRPNVEREVALYTLEERRMLEVRPGITDISSLVFFDLAEILASAEDPNIAYNQLVRPWKSRLALFYLDHRTLASDIWVLIATVIAVFSRSLALKSVVCLLKRMSAPGDLVEIAGRSRLLVPTPPPGSSEIVVSRGG